MPRRLLRRYIPTPQVLREHSALRPLGALLYKHPEIWHLHRRSVSGACFIGLFCAFLPIPLQMLVAAIIAIATRCNLPVAVALVWVTNPITMPPVFFFAYKLGAWLLGTHLVIDAVELDLAWLTSQVAQVWKPLLVGSLVCGWVSGVSAFVIVRVLWRVHVIRLWRERRERRLNRSSLHQ
jgi:uncharacterized protein (DUF2062 family)